MSNVTKQLPKWWQVYSNDEEKRLFTGKDGTSGLARSPDYEWRSTDALAKEAGLTKRRTEEILDKYHKVGVVCQSSKDPEKWGYWERVKPDANKPDKSVVQADQDKRTDKADSTKKKATPTAPAGNSTPTNPTGGKSAPTGTAPGGKSGTAPKKKIVTAAPKP
jgi:hypothetical protein